MKGILPSQYESRQVRVYFCDSFQALLKRDWTALVRNPLLVKSRLLQMVFLATYLGGIYFNAGRKDFTPYENWKAISGFMFQISIATMMQSV